MKQDILEIVNHKSGETVPEGYFDAFKQKMKMELPDRKWEYEGADDKAYPAHRSWWSKIRPYAYMAAMFAGVWLMMNMFTLFQPARTGEISDSEYLLAAVNNDAFVNDFVTPEIDNYELLDDLYDEGFDPSQIEEWIEE